VPGFLSLVRRRWQVLSSSKTAHDSSVRDASLMAVDTSGNFETDLQRLLDEES
jgi:hypothetical protein